MLVCFINNVKFVSMVKLGIVGVNFILFHNKSFKQWLFSAVTESK